MADITMSFFSAAMARHVTIQAIVPFDLAGTGELFNYSAPFKTLYFLPGFSANAQNIVSTTTLAAYAQARGFAVIIPDGENSFYTNQEDINALYEKFVSEELVAVTRRIFPLSDRREDTYIGGISMGGFGSLMLGSRHPDVFSKVIALSPAIYPYRQNLLAAGFTTRQLDRYFGSESYFRENYYPLNNFKKLKDAGAQMPSIFLCCGEQDPLTYEQDVEFVQGMAEAGMPVAHEWGEGSHETMYWNAHLPSAIDFMMKD